MNVLTETSNDTQWRPLANRLVATIQPLGSCVVAFSGGVDSAVVAKAARVALGSKAIAITGDSSSLAEDEQKCAARVAEQIGIDHIVMPTHELANPNYLANDGRRCYYCKSELYQRLQQWADENNFNHVLSGTNLDDLGDYRPGLDAARERGVFAPLVECGIGKEQVRGLAHYWQLEIADKPASPCLSSRVAYGESISEDKLRMIEAAERFLKSKGFADVRVRYHAGGLARIEVGSSELDRAWAARADILTAFQQLGFAFITIDLGARQSGSLNRILPMVQIRVK